MLARRQGLGRRRGSGKDEFDFGLVYDSATEPSFPEDAAQEEEDDRVRAVGNGALGTGMQSNPLRIYNANGVEARDGCAHGGGDSLEPWSPELFGPEMF